MDTVTQNMVEHAVATQQHLRAEAVLLYGGVFSDDAALAGALEALRGVPCILAAGPLTSRPEGLRVIEVPPIRLSRFGQLRMAIFMGLSRGLLRRGDRLVCLSGMAGSNALDMLVVLELGAQVELFGPAEVEDISADIRPEVFERVLRLAVGLGHEGREGKPIGTLFVVGDTDAVLHRCEQMVLNPFLGHPPEVRNVLDSALEETIREFATIDGAFVVRGDGLVETAGVFLQAAGEAAPLPPGLGARHQSAAAVTAATGAVAVAVSESSGAVRVFRGGRIILELKRVAPHRAAGT